MWWMFAEYQGRSKGLVPVSVLLPSFLALEMKVLELDPVLLLTLLVQVCQKVNVTIESMPSSALPSPVYK